ncbi:PREDICTED: uncharacterized protein C19orf44 homolog [Crocodylus porosus]|uniref:Chromosome 19 open reading frame 44 n=1 Tax=Crocodylus porosus TaxID=8502 RepID=A0A7M4G2E3_CROPO|nr:PREDICTED: uncharacterized protein C19orf44 homolog [Crocodylus porosus]
MRREEEGPWSQRRRAHVPWESTSTPQHRGLADSSGHLSLHGAAVEETRSPLFRRSRFLKNKKSIEGIQRSRAQAGGNGPAACPTQETAAEVASHTALGQLVRTQGKNIARGLQMDLSSTDLARNISNKSFSASHEPNARGSRYLKKSSVLDGRVTLHTSCSKREESNQPIEKKAPVKARFDLDSDEEEMRVLLGSSLAFSSDNKDRKDSTHNAKHCEKSFLKTKLKTSPGTPLLPHRPPSQTSVFSAPSPCTESSQERNHRRTRPQASSSSDRNSPNQISLSERCEIKSLDELFSRASSTQNSISESSDDFRVNILSLDELAPSISCKREDLQQKKTDTTKVKKSDVEKGINVFQANSDQLPLKVRSAGMRTNIDFDSDIEEGIGTEAEISEHLSGISENFPSLQQDVFEPTESTVHSEYSENFEKSVSAIVSGTTNRRSPSETLMEHPNSSVHSRETHSLSLSSSLSNKKWHGTVNRVMVKETAVQTADFPFTYCWSKMDGTAILGPTAGHSYLDPIPVASHVVSMDMVEALTAYSPAVFVLNDMLKQHLMLTQQFVETFHHLHLSLVESLEHENFRYHTLEEAKEYIRSHKSPPLTTEQALEEVKKVQEQ